MSYGPAVPRASMTGEALRRVRAAWRENDNVRRGDARVALLFLLPDLIGFVMFTLAGILGTFGISFLHWNLVQPPNWVGLENYRDLGGRSIGRPPRNPPPQIAFAIGCLSA